MLVQHTVPDIVSTAVDDFLLDEEFDSFDMGSSRNSVPDMEVLALACDNVMWDKSVSEPSDAFS